MKKGFSLIELLISLIIVSLLIAAFMPLITKKLKASDITVGSFGSGGNNLITRNVTKEDCDSLNAIFIPASEKVLKPLCVMKYNIGDDEKSSWGGVQKCVIGSDCTVENAKSDDVTKENLKPTCWVATSDKNTAGEGCNANFGGYDGCKRTVCNWTGANRMCENIGWRLPTFDELTAFTNDTYSSKTAFESGNGSLMFCNHSENTTSPVCPALEKGSLNTYDGSYLPYDLWSSSFETTSTVWGRRLNGDWHDNEYKLGFVFSARCVLDNMVEEIKKPSKPSEDEETVNSEKPSEEFCAKFDAMYIPASLSGSTDMCVTKYNVGDVTSSGRGPDIAEGVEVHGVGGTCTSSGFCCWKGPTSSACTDTGNGEGENASTYSGCNRTVCQWSAAFASCAMWNPKGLPTGSWRLPTDAEMSFWATKIDLLDKNQGNKGLQLCGRVAGYGSVQCQYLDAKCIKSHDNGCYADRYWVQTARSSGNYYNYRYNMGAIEDQAYHPTSLAASARCVYDGKINNSGIEINKDKQAICDKYNALYIPSKYNGTSDDLCVTKYNVGDDGGPTFSNYEALGVVMLGAGGTCTKSGYCCWQGPTSETCTTTGNGNSTYSGCNRTVCQWSAANEMCKNWNPDGTTAGKWRMPTSGEFAKWGTKIDILNKNQGSKGLQLCDRVAGYGSAQCQYLDAKCIKSHDNGCYADRYWVQTARSSDNYYNYRCNKGTIEDQAYHPTSLAASARCVSSEVLKE